MPFDINIDRWHHLCSMGTRTRRTLWSYDLCSKGVTLVLHNSSTFHDDDDDDADDDADDNDENQYCEKH